MIPKPPIFIYECASGPAENAGRYQTILLKGGPSVLTPMIREYADWMGTEDGEHCVFGLHLLDSKIARGTMDIDAGLLARAGLRGERVKQLAYAFPRYLTSLLNAYRKGRTLVYLGSLLSDSMNAYLVKHGATEWTRRAWACVKPYLLIAKRTGRLDIAIDASSAMDLRGHVGLAFLEDLEATLAGYGCKLYVEGVPVPSPERGPMMARNWIARGDNWDDAVAKNTTASDASLLTGEGIRWPAGLRKKPTKSELLKLLGDTTKRGHRLAGDARFLIEDIGAADWPAYQKLAADATTEGDD